MNDTPDSSEPALAVEAPAVSGRLLPWPLSVLLLSAACFLAMAVCVLGAASYKPFVSEWLAGSFALVFVLGLDPFYMRRNVRFDARGLLWVAGVGLLIASTSFLFKGNPAALVWIGMTWMLVRVGRPTERGKQIDYQIGLEEKTSSNPPTGQNERMLMLGDFAIVVFFAFLLLYAWNAIGAEPPPPSHPSMSTINEPHDPARSRAGGDVFNHGARIETE